MSIVQSIIEIPYEWPELPGDDPLAPAKIARSVATASLAAAAEDVGADRAEYRDRLCEGVAAFRILFGPLLVRDPETVAFKTGRHSVTLDIDPPDSLLSPALVRTAIEAALSADLMVDAAAFGSLPTQRFLDRSDRQLDRITLFWTFALASAVRGNLAAYERAAENARYAADGRDVLDIGRARGSILPAIAAIDAILAGKPRVVERQIGKLVRYHQWLHRDSNSVQRSFDMLATGLVRWAASRGVAVAVTSPVVPAI